jgi:hypothetical protein
MLHRPETTTFPLLALFLALAPASGLAQTPAPAENTSEVRIQHPENFCMGGIEDGKIIVDEARLSDPFRETTRLGCQVDGGDPHTMPDLPTPTAELRLRV